MVQTPHHELIAGSVLHTTSACVDRQEQLRCVAYQAVHAGSCANSEERSFS